MVSSTQAASGPVKEVLARRLDMNVPPVIPGVVLAAVGVDQRLDKDGRVGIGLILSLKLKEPTLIYVFSAISVVIRSSKKPE